MEHLTFQGQPIPIDWPLVRRAFEEDHATLSGYIPGANGKQRYGQRPFKSYPPDALRPEIRYVVFHHSVTADTKTTDKILRQRNLSVHMGVDPDGTVVQLLDLGVRDWSSGEANDRGVGVEVANVVEPYGGYTWQKPPPGYEGRQVVSGPIGGVERRSFAFTDEQLGACAALAAALCAHFPRMAPAWPGVADNSRRAAALKGERYGVLGHYHITGDAKTGKWDPGPGFRFPSVVLAARQAVARKILGEIDLEAGDWADPLRMQRALQCLGRDVAADGQWGPESEAAMDAVCADDKTGRVLVEKLKLLLQERP